MDRSFIRRLTRGASLAVAVAAGVALSGGHMLGATPVAHHGPQGHYSFTDTVGSPGAKCIYEGASHAHEFDRMKVKGPKVFWLTSDAFDDGFIRESLRLQHWNGSAWTTVRHTAEHQGFASKTTATQFGPMVVHWIAPHTNRYRVEVLIRWVTPDNDTIGSVTVLIDHYLVGYNSTVQSSCRAHVNNPI